MDREKVITGLKWHIRITRARECRYALVDCPYVDECKTGGSVKLLEDAIALLNEQEERIKTLESLRRIEQEGR